MPDLREQPKVMPVLMQELRRALREGGFGAEQRTAVEQR